MSFLRPPAGRRARSDELIVCATCCTDFVSPIEWPAHDEANWWMRLCGEVRDVIVSQEVADRYDRASDFIARRGSPDAA